jgi:antagonist of KipI
MARGQRAGNSHIVTAGDSALLVRMGSRPGPATSRRVLALVAALDTAAPPGLLDIIPAYASVLVRFDPLIVEPAVMTAFLRAALAQTSHDANAIDAADNGGGQPARGRMVRIPVCYGGDNGPDIAEVASLLGLTPRELIQRHSSATYRVAFLGFLAGFPYLTGLPRALAVPRLDTPRTHVPMGSVAIAERQAGIYPVDSPGGWRILGRTHVPLFDPEREPPSLLRPGDRVRFYLSVGDEHECVMPSTRQRTQHKGMGIPWLRVIQPGIQATVQDRGRPGYARFGVSTSGAADPDALTIGNALLANQPEAAALEITGGNARFETLAPCVVAVTGAPSGVRINERRIQSGVTVALDTGDTLEIEALSAGMRAYLSVAAGVAVPLVLGSRATDLRAHIGGFGGRSLRTGDLLERRDANDDGAGRVVPYELIRRAPCNREWLLRVLSGPRAAQSRDSFDVLLAGKFTVDTRSDRVGVRLRRLTGPCLDGGQTLTEGMARGAVQVPPDGEPVLLLADAQATGGYHVPAVVIAADLWQIGQLRPGDSVRFRGVTPDEALAALRRRADEIARVLRQPAPAQLLSGFTEWSDNAEPPMKTRNGDDDG